MDGVENAERSGAFSKGLVENAQRSGAFSKVAVGVLVEKPKAFPQPSTATVSPGTIHSRTPVVTTQTQPVRQNAKPRPPVEASCFVEGGALAGVTRTS